MGLIGARLGVKDPPQSLRLFLPRAELPPRPEWRPKIGEVHGKIGDLRDGHGPLDLALT